MMIYFCLTLSLIGFNYDQEVQQISDRQKTVLDQGQREIDQLSQFQSQLSEIQAALLLSAPQSGRVVSSSRADIYGLVLLQSLALNDDLRRAQEAKVWVMDVMTRAEQGLLSFEGLKQDWLTQAHDLKTQLATQIDHLQDLTRKAAELEDKVFSQRLAGVRQGLIDRLNTESKELAFLAELKILEEAFRKWDVVVESHLERGDRVAAARMLLGMETLWALLPLKTLELEMTDRLLEAWDRFERNTQKIVQSSKASLAQIEPVGFRFGVSGGGSLPTVLALMSFASVPSEGDPSDDAAEEPPQDEMDRGPMDTPDGSFQSGNRIEFFFSEDSEGFDTHNPMSSLEFEKFEISSGDRLRGEVTELVREGVGEMVNSQMGERVHDFYDRVGEIREAERSRDHRESLDRVLAATKSLDTAVRQIEARSAEGKTSIQVARESVKNQTNFQCTVAKNYQGPTIGPAQPNLMTEAQFAAWKKDQLAPIARALALPGTIGAGILAGGVVARIGASVPEVTVSLVKVYESVQVRLATIFAQVGAQNVQKIRDAVESVSFAVSDTSRGTYPTDQTKLAVWAALKAFKNIERACHGQQTDLQKLEAEIDRLLKLP